MATQFSCGFAWSNNSIWLWKKASWVSDKTCDFTSSQGHRFKSALNSQRPSRQNHPPRNLRPMSWSRLASSGRGQAPRSRKSKLQWRSHWNKAQKSFPRASKSDFFFNHLYLNSSKCKLKVLSKIKVLSKVLTLFSNFLKLNSKFGKDYLQVFSSE